MSPEIPGYRAIPLVRGRADLPRFFADPIRHLLTLSRRHGAVAAMTAGDPSMVFAFGAEHNRTVLSDPGSFRNLVEVPVRVPPGSAASRLFTGLMSMNGEAHRRHRRLLMPALSKSAVAGYAPDVADVTARYVTRWTAGAPFDVMREGAALTTAVLLRCLFDADGDADVGRLGNLGVKLLGLFTSPLTILLPLRVRGTPYAEFLDTCEGIEATMRRFVAARRRGGTAGRDVLSALLRARDEEAGALTDDEVIAHTVSLIFAGQDTVAATLSLTLMLLAQHPAVLGDLGDELDAALRGAPPSPDDLSRLPLLDAVVNESMRVLPPIVHLLFRQPAEPRSLGPYTVPPGAKVVLSPLVTHRDPEVFPDPLRFDPARWSASPPGPYAYMPFGAGPRLCVGAVFAGQVLRAQLATILQHHRPVVLPGTRVDLAVRAANLGTRAPLPLRLVPRREALRPPEPVRGDVRALVRLPD